MARKASRSGPKCGAPVWRCTNCRKAVAAATGNKQPSRCPRKGCGDTEIVAGSCEQPAGFRTPHPGEGPCRWHGGNAVQVVAAAQRRLLAAEATTELARLGVSIETTPIEALEAMLWEAAGNVAVLRDLVAGLALEVSRYRWEETEDGGQLVPPDGDGIAGASYHQSGVPTGEAKPHVFVVMYDDERDRLAKLGEACAKLGLDERRVQLAEAQTERLLAGVTRAIAAVGLDAGQTQQFKLALARELRAG